MELNLGIEHLWITSTRENQLCFKHAVQAAHAGQFVSTNIVNDADRDFETCEICRKLFGMCSHLTELPEWAS